jgi:predicted hotdog family 3-hydroxylacyl-ACP dehydratase
MTAAGGAGFRLLRLDVAPAPEAPQPATQPLPGRSGLSAVAELLVPAGGPIFAGHFPGRPLLPGIAHLALLCQVLEELAARGILGGEAPGNTAIVEVRRFRLRREIVPGDRIELRVEGWDEAGAEGGGCRFDLRRQPAAGQPGEIASEGTVRTGTGSAKPHASAPTPRPDLAPGGSFRPVADLVPHAPPARLLTEVLAGGAGGILCAGSIPADHPLAAGGEAPGFLAIELGAQAAAAFEALARPPGRRPRIGYLVGVRDAHLPARLPTGRTLRVTAVPAGAAAALAIYEMQVAEEGAAEPLAAGTISTFLAES